MSCGTHNFFRQYILPRIGLLKIITDFIGKASASGSRNCAWCCVSISHIVLMILSRVNYFIFFFFRELLRVLATFPKILVAGVHGAAIGFGVTILPLFDLVLASDKATFSVPATKYGYIPEGTSLMPCYRLLSQSVVSIQKSQYCTKYV